MDPQRTTQAEALPPCTQRICALIAGSGKVRALPTWMQHIAVEWPAAHHQQGRAQREERIRIHGCHQRCL